MGTAFWIYGGLLIALAIIVLIIAGVGMTRNVNKRRATNEVAGEKSIPRDPTRNTREEDIEDTTGDFSRSVRDVPQDARKNSSSDSK